MQRVTWGHDDSSKNSSLSDRSRYVENQPDNAVPNDETPYIENTQSVHCFFYFHFHVYCATRISLEWFSLVLVSRRVRRVVVMAKARGNNCEAALRSGLGVIESRRRLYALAIHEVIDVLFIMYKGRGRTACSTEGTESQIVGQMPRDNASTESKAQQTHAENPPACSHFPQFLFPNGSRP